MTYNSFLFFERVFRWSFLTYSVRRNDFSHSLTMQPTAGRRDASLYLMKTHSLQFTLASASGG